MCYSQPQGALQSVQQHNILYPQTLDSNKEKPPKNPFRQKKQKKP